MDVKIDTKEKFTVITPQLINISANMTDSLNDLLVAYMQKDIPHIILNMTNVENIDADIAEKIVTIQQRFYENDNSFVVCCLQKTVEDFLDKEELLEVMNVTPTESEAWDIVQMEEIEREMFGEEG